MPLIDECRGGRVVALRAALESAVAGSTTTLLGSLASGSADRYSDIDLRWCVGAAGPDVVRRCAELLGRAAPVESLRFDPDLDGTGDRRLALVRFVGWPLFSRVDLEIVGQFDAVAPIGSWSAQESAMMNVVGALKADLREQPDTVEGLLTRGFERIAAADPGGAAPARMRALVAGASAQSPALAGLAAAIDAALTERTDLDRTVQVGPPTAGDTTGGG